MDTPIYYHSRLVEDHTLRNKNKGIHFITEWQFTRFFDKVIFLLLIFNIHFFLKPCLDAYRSDDDRLGIFTWRGAYRWIKIRVCPAAVLVFRQKVFVLFVTLLREPVLKMHI